MKRFVLAALAAFALPAAAMAQDDGLVKDNRFEIYFEPSSAELSSSAKAVVEMIVNRYADRDDAVFYLSGHTDTLRLSSINLVLSATMAIEVARYMEELGVPESRISLAAFGESSLAVKTADGIGEPLNRRVVVNIYLPKDEAGE